MECDGKKMERYDRWQIRCPRLGGEVFFHYCEREGGNLPCSRIMSCWQMFLPIENYLRETLSAEEWVRFTSQAPKDKVTSLIEMIEQAKKHTS